MTYEYPPVPAGWWSTQGRAQKLVKIDTMSAPVFTQRSSMALPPPPIANRHIIEQMAPAPQAKHRVMHPCILRRASACCHSTHTVLSTRESTSLQCMRYQTDSLGLSAVEPPDAVVSIPRAAAVHMFGVRHTERQQHIAEHILHFRPAAVVVETAMNAMHGSERGTVMNFDDPDTLQHLQSDLYARMFYQMGAQLRDQPEPWLTDTWKA